MACKPSLAMGTARSLENDVNALDLLTEQHDKIDALIDAIEIEPVIERRQFLFDELAAHVSAHATMEEKLFYPTVRAEQTQEILLASAEEHMAIDRGLADLLATDVDDKRFDAKLSVLREAIEHHARAEEQILFPKLRHMMSREQLIILGVEMLAMFEHLIATRATGAGQAGLPVASST